MAVAIGIACVLLITLWLYAERWRPLRSSTWRYLREVGLGRLFSHKTLHAYVYARWIKQYIGFCVNWLFPRLGPKGKRWVADRYHAKVLTTDQAKAVVTVNRDIPLQDLEQIIPYPLARELVLKGPPDIAVFECACRQIRDNPCEPSQVCMVIGQPFVDFILEHHPKTSRRVTQAEAVELLETEHARGHLQSAWFKDVLLNRFYAICNCCKCCCAGIEGMVRHGIPMVASSGYVAQVDETQCTACGECGDACPFDAIELREAATVNWDACMGCGVCVGQCPAEAMSLVRDERKGLPLDVRLLAEDSRV